MVQGHLLPTFQRHGDVYACAVDITIQDNPTQLEQIFVNLLLIALGLSICARIMKAHGGSIQADRSPAGGARFILRFPALADNTTMRSSTSASAPNSTGCDPKLWTGFPLHYSYTRSDFLRSSSL